MDSKDPAVAAIIERITNMLVTLTTYRMRHRDDRSVEVLMEQLELIRDHLISGVPLTLSEKESLHFNSVAGSPLEHDDAMATELQSIRSFAAHSL
jgi:hypothetical protein